MSIPAEVDGLDPAHLAKLCSLQAPEVVVLGQVRWMRTEAPVQTESASGAQAAADPSPLTRGVLVHLCTPHPRSKEDARLEADVRQRRAALARKLQDLR